MPKANFKKGKPAPAGKNKFTLLKVLIVDNKFFNAAVDAPELAKRWEWHFVLDTDPEIIIRKWSGPNISTWQGNKSICRRLFETLLDTELTDKTKDKFGDGDTDPLIGQKLFLTIKHETKDGKISAKIFDFESVTGKAF